MKKIKLISLIVCLALLLGSTVSGVAATGATDTTEPSEASEQTQPLPQSGDVAFGSLPTSSGCRTIDGRVPLGGSDRMLESAQAAFVYELNTQSVIYGFNPDLKLYPGSMLKILTALIAIEESSLSEPVRVNTNSISRLPFGTITAKLKNGEIITMEDALHFLLLTSANDAALVIAEHIGGSEAVFAEMMNERVEKMGCTNTSIMNCHGLDREGQYTTARDMAKIMMTAMENETFRKIIACKEYDVQPTNKVDKVRTINTGNHLMYAMVLPQFTDLRVTAGMPSYTSAESGASVVFTAEDEGMSFVYVIMGATRTFYEKSGKAKYYGNFEEALTLLDYSFDEFHIKQVLYDGQALNQFPVSNGECEVVGHPRESFSTVLPVKVHMKDLRFTYHPKGGGLSAPVETGEEISTVDIWYRSSCIHQARIYSMNPVRAIKDTGVEIVGAQRNDSAVTGILSVLGIILLIAVLGIGGYLGYNYLRRYMRRYMRRRRRASRRRSR